MDRTESIARAVAKIARRGLVGDGAAIERVLRLKGMTAALKWQEANSVERGAGQRAQFAASRDSPIRELYFSRRQQYLNDFTDSLSVRFKEGSCVSEETAEAAFGMELGVTMIHDSHGNFPPYPYRSLNVTDPDGRRIHVAFEDEGCEIRLSWPSAPAE